MPKGGARVGAGRKPGIPNKKTVADTVAAEATGVMPKAVMLEEMRLHYAAYGREIAKKKPDWAKAEAALAKAREAAKDAAPYFHARLSAVAQSTTPLDLSNATDEELVVIERLLERAHARGSENGAPAPRAAAPEGPGRTRH